jgi:hypothetical protein
MHQWIIEPLNMWLSGSGNCLCPDLQIPLNQGKKDPGSWSRINFLRSSGALIWEHFFYSEPFSIVVFIYLNCLFIDGYLLWELIWWRLYHCFQSVWRWQCWNYKVIRVSWCQWPCGIYQSNRASYWWCQWWD